MVSVSVLHWFHFVPAAHLLNFVSSVVGTSNPHFSKLPLTINSTGIGLFFSAFMIGLTALQARYTVFSPKNSEEFTSASRSVKPGLIASGIVSAWTWAATLVSPSLSFLKIEELIIET